ncbi:hypothetical protein MUCCIDRAFT_162045 [Mucor lusitanicus CBS 277.49]|uniref:Uncharacterized protein n=1 Tax=Mucor lusitanicus CBS 277.49 TaxID=747725 RepID=A0A168MTR8_MUCCL|nr:hypothetical protein MUCCIDRAFT_162045 [Mucor lusitanicus CBS 277.49]
MVTDHQMRPLFDLVGHASVVLLSVNGRTQLQLAVKRCSVLSGSVLQVATSKIKVHNVVLTVRLRVARTVVLDTSDCIIVFVPYFLVATSIRGCISARLEDNYADAIGIYSASKHDRDSSKYGQVLSYARILKYYESAKAKRFSANVKQLHVRF